MEPQQLDLFAENPVQTSSTRPQTLSMDSLALARWKAEIAVYQQQVRESQPPQQTTLFDLAQVHCDPETIDPLTLQLQAMSFYRMPTDSPGESCLYLALSRDTCKKLQDGLKTLAIYSFYLFLSKIDSYMQFWRMYRYKNRSIY